MELTIIKFNGTNYVESREVAKLIGKRHDNLIRDIETYLKTLEKSNVLNFEGINFFVKSSYVDARGRTKPCYLLTKSGCELCSNKLIGEKGILFTAAYVTKFNEMEALEREAEMKANQRPKLSDFNAAVRNVLTGMSYSRTSPEQVMDFLNKVYTPLGVEVLSEKQTEDFYSPTLIAMVLGITSETGKPHGHAIAAIISKLDIPEKHIAVVPFGLVGVAFRYDIEVIKAIMYWLLDNDFPSEVSYLNFYYHIHYKRDEIEWLIEEEERNLYGEDNKHNDFDTCNNCDYLGDIYIFDPEDNFYHDWLQGRII